MSNRCPLSELIPTAPIPPLPALPTSSCPQCIFTSVSILLSNSVDDPRYLGTVNGAAQTASMVFSALAPSLSASFYSWTASLQGPILNTNFWFYVIAAMYVSMVAVAGLFTNQAEIRRWGPGAPK